MKLTKKLEAEILELYHKYWDAYLNGKMKTMSSMMDKNCHVIGSGMGEVFNNKKDAIKYYTDTADQVSGKSEVRNKKINVMLAGSNILVTEESDYFVFMDKSWTFYGQARISTLFGKSKNKWKIIQQHGSLPDSRTGGGEQLNTDKIKEENLRLKEAIKRRTIELENKNRELEIEAALERVRASTMAMQKSDELSETAQVLFQQFSELGENPDQLSIAIVNESERVLETWLSVQGNHFNRMFKVSIDEPIVINKIYKAWKRKKKSLVIDISGDELEEYNEFRNSLDEFKEYNEVKRSKSKEENRRVIYCAFFSKGMFSLATPESQPDETLNLLERFASVFDGTYTRFLDLQKAEAQAREAQIETALEKVRSRTMAMHKSDELAETASHLFIQLNDLGIKPYRCNIGIVNAENDKCQLWTTTNKGDVIPLGTFIPLTETPLFIEIYAAWKSKLPHSVIKLVGKDRLEMIKYFIQFIPFAEFKPEQMTLEKVSQVTSIFNTFMFKQGFISIHTNEEISEEDLNVIHRFTKVFEQTYTRFLDLQKAEAQAREAMIEASLERVRARSMAMHTSTEMMEVIQIIFQELSKLGIDVMECSIVTYDNNPKDLIYWSSGSYATDEPSMIKFQYIDHPILVDLFKDLENGVQYRSKEFSGELLRSWWDRVFSETDFKNIPNEIIKSWKEIKHVFYAQATMNHGFLEFVGETPLSDDKVQIIKRFTKVVDLTYTRFDDVKKAEAQAREAQIEAALERVRSKTMAMHNSQDVGATVVTLFDEVLKLGLDKSIRVGIGILEGNEGMETWSATSTPDGKVDLKMGMLDMSIHPMLIGLKKAWESGKTGYSYDYIGDDVFRYYEALNNEPDYPFQADLDSLPENEYHKSFFYREGILFSFAPNPISDEAAKVLDRFAGVFGQTYRRYLDLQKAEAQVREAQIETALERVRARTMAMHKSDELAETAGVLFEQMVSLGIVLKRCVISIINQTTDNASFWLTSSDGKVIPGSDLVPLTEEKHLNEMYRAWKEKKTHFSFKVSREERLDWTMYIINKVKMHLPEYQPDTINKEQILNEPAVFNSFFFSHGFVMLHTVEDLTEDHIKMLKRFASVFEQTYTRFLDLQRAEAQEREAKIEASLERVRSKAMAMHSPDDLSETVNVFFKELKALEIVPIRCGVAQIDEATRATNLTTTTSSQQGDSFEVIGKIKQTGHPVLDGIFENWKLQKEYHPVLEGEDIKAYYDVMNAQIAYPEYSEETTQFGNLFPFKEGFVFAWTESKLSEEELQIFRRFTSVLSLTYRRYIDLKEAGVRAFDAIKQASLDRVRAEIASMRTSEDLNHITPIIWRELKTLEVPFFRCGVFIVDEDKTEVLVYLTTPDGKSLGVLNLPFESSRLTITTVEFWKQQKVYHEHWNKGEFIKWTKSMMELGQVQNAETYQGSAEPPESLDLHFVPFSQGMLYVGDTSPLNDDKLQLVKILAEAFSIAYARYEDFKHLEEAKARVEVTLSELKSAQAQLVHAEKMASLGELTAGIAHEIKNPLNFVNNFSEVSRELLDEMKVEIQNNNLEEVIELVEDLKQNLEKINTHGKRADSIVKGMLLHSRGTSGEKTLTDINDLLDQYVTLAYHGLRAQDKEFNITIEKDYDDTLEKINVVPQDISRVFLNIVNNACYAANEKKKNSGNNFSPLLKVSTKKLHDNVEIRISDNGNGIPASIKEQIFNPFFTTKPTGEGTGLGLSLSYDIVTKVHGGNIKVESEEGKGAMFIIELPLS